MIVLRGCFQKLTVSRREGKEKGRIQTLNFIWNLVLENTQSLANTFSNNQPEHFILRFVCIHLYVNKKEYVLLQKI